MRSPLQGVVSFETLTFLAATRHSLTLGLARYNREPRLTRRVRFAALQIILSRHSAKRVGGLSRRSSCFAYVRFTLVCFLPFIFKQAVLKFILPLAFGARLF